MVDRLEPRIDFSNFPKTNPRYSSSRKAMFNFVKVDTSDNIIHAFLGEKKKSYQLYTSTKDNPLISFSSVNEMRRKTIKKGCPQRSAKDIKDKDILSLIKNPGIIKANFNKLQSKKHIISMIHQQKNVSNSFDNSAMYKSCELCNVPFHCTLSSIEICDSIDCQRDRLLVNIWYRLVCII